MKRKHGINTSVSVRKPQTIPPSGMPPQAKLNHIVPTPDNKIQTEMFITTESQTDDSKDTENATTNVNIVQSIEIPQINFIQKGAILSFYNN